MKLIFLVCIFTLMTTVQAEEVPLKQMKNVVLIIGDGMDDHQITIARNYLKGVKGRLNLDEMSVRASVQVLTVDEDDPTKPIYVADSANSATAMATGFVTSRGRIATSAQADADLQTIVELAHNAGFKTGLVTTSSVTDATPASFVAHINLRACESPQTMNFEKRGVLVDCSRDQKANGGLGSISEQIAVSDLDVVLGGGREHFDMKAEASEVTVEEMARASGFTVLHSKQALIDAKAAERLLGLFADSHLPTKLHGEAGRVAEKPEPSLLNSVHWSLGEVELPAAMDCVDNPEYGETPSMNLMTSKALDHLSRNNETGFFLMIESASIDKQSHVRNACGSIGELDQLDESLATVLAFARTHPDTLVMVTADHGQAAQLVPNESLFSLIGIPVFTPGQLVRIKMPDDGEMAVNYATNSFLAEEHTGVAVPLHANELGRPLIRTLITQPEIFEVTRKFLGL
ncbi:MAG: alkaline phosphatase [Candidatus Azotimanducaceae bacterium]|jgi:alkaline phosphatase